MFIRRHPPRRRGRWRNGGGWEREREDEKLGWWLIYGKLQDQGERKGTSSEKEGEEREGQKEVDVWLALDEEEEEIRRNGQKYWGLVYDYVIEGLKMISNQKNTVPNSFFHDSSLFRGLI